MARFSHLARVLDPRIPTNLFAVLSTLAAAAVVGVRGGDVEAMIRAAGGVFLAWMIGREIDPDRPASAVVAGALTFGLMVAKPEAALGALILVGVAARVVSRSTGRAPKTTDLVVLLVGAVAFSLGSFAWVAAVGLAVAVVLDARSDVDHGEDGGSARLWWGAAIGVTSLVAAGIAPGDGWARPAGWMWAIVGAGAVGGALLARFEPVDALADLTREPLDPDRLRVARLLVVAAVAVGTLAGGEAGVMGLSPAWIALAVAGANRAIATGITEVAS